MPYSVTTTSGATTIVIADGAVDTSQLSVALVGRNATNYGDDIARNSIRMLETFANSSAPTPGSKLVGQQWYDTGSSAIRVWDGTVWKTATSILVSSTAPASSLAAGSAYFDTVVNKLRVYNGTTFKDASYPGTITGAYLGNAAVGTPTHYGSQVKTIFFLEATTLSAKPVLAFVYVSDGSVNGGATAGETIMALFSDHAAFAVDATDPYYSELAAANGIGTTIRIGLNQRLEYAATSTPLSEISVTTDNIHTSGGNVDVDNVIHTGRSYIPSTGNTYSLGSSTNTFDKLYVNDIVVGNGTSGTVTVNGTVNLGTTGTRLGNIWATTVTATTFDGVATSAKYADLAEIYESDFNYEPGTVLVIGGSEIVTICNEESSRNVFGVVSSEPGLLLNSKATGVMVALNGRVPVKVHGNVSKGDRLVSSSEPGLARTLTEDEVYDPRMIIGRALSDDVNGVVEARVGTV